MTLGYVIESMVLELRKHFDAKPYKHYSARRKNAEKQILSIYGLTVDRLRDSGEIPWADAATIKAWASDFGDIIVNKWICSATDKMYDAYEKTQELTGTNIGGE